MRIHYLQVKSRRVIPIRNDTEHRFDQRLQHRALNQDVSQQCPKISFEAHIQPITYNEYFNSLYPVLFILNTAIERHTCTFKENHPFRFRNTSPLFPPGLAIRI